MEHSNREMVVSFTSYKLSQQNYPTLQLGPDSASEKALRESADEFELRYVQAFSDMSSRLHITPATAYNSFENVVDEVFRDGNKWGRIVGLFAFGGALCVDCVQKDMNHMVPRIVDWMTICLDHHLHPWIQSQGGWDHFAEVFGGDAVAKARRWKESLRRWTLVGVVPLTGAYSTCSL